MDRKFTVWDIDVDGQKVAAVVKIKAPDNGPGPITFYIRQENPMISVSASDLVELNEALRLALDRDSLIDWKGPFMKVAMNPYGDELRVDEIDLGVHRTTGAHCWRFTGRQGAIYGTPSLSGYEALILNDSAFIDEMNRALRDASTTEERARLTVKAKIAERNILEREERVGG